MLKTLETQHTLMLRQLDEQRAVVELMWAQVVETSLNDPATDILPYLVAPLVRDRLEAKASNPTVLCSLLRSKVGDVCRQRIDAKPHLNPA